VTMQAGPDPRGFGARVHAPGVDIWAGASAVTADAVADMTLADGPGTGPTQKRTTGHVLCPGQGNAMKPGHGRVSDRTVLGTASLAGRYPETVNSAT